MRHSQTSEKKDERIHTMGVTDHPKQIEIHG